MPLLGKIVVIKRSGEDGTEFPLTAACLFGRKLNCDIRIQLPHVSKEHCRIDVNENKELILTNLSSVNPTLINGKVFNQSERLKHGDLITIIDRSFRFEYPPPKTPKKKRPSAIGNDKTPQQDKTPVPVEKRKSEHTFDSCLKDGSNLPQFVEQTETVPDAKLKDSLSPFGELYQMVKQDLSTKSPWKSGLSMTPLARPQNDYEEPEVPPDMKSSAKQVTTPSAKRRKSSKGSSEDKAEPAVPAAVTSPVKSSVTPLLERSITSVSQKERTPSKTPEKFSAAEVVQKIQEPQPDEKTPKSSKRRSNASQGESSPLQTSSGLPQTSGLEGKNTEVKMSPRTSPRSNAGKRFQVQDVLHEIKTTTLASEDKELHTNATIPNTRTKRVSFGGQLSPELFDKRLPPDSPLRRGATPGRRSLGPSLKSQSLLRRASTIGLLALRLQETVPESTKSSPAKNASPKRKTSTAKTPSPAKRSPSTKTKTPSPKHQKSPLSAAKTPSPATPTTPASSRKASTSAIEAEGSGSVIQTPSVQGRFSISRISTPSPVQDQAETASEQTAVEECQVSVTPKIPIRRKSMKSARKTPRSTIKSALDVMRSRRSGASRANLKVLNSWADIVKFGQTKPQAEVPANKKMTKISVVRRTVVSKPKTPAQRLKDDISTGHAASPATIVVGRAHMRSNRCVGAAPKIVPNVAVCKKDMRMDEDLTGVADIFKTPANSKSKNMVLMNSACPQTPLDESSVIKTPEELGEMMVSPLSVLSTAKHDRYNSEAVTRLLLDDQDASLLDEDGLSQPTDSTVDEHSKVEMSQGDQTWEEEGVLETTVKTPKQAVTPSSCLTGVKRLMKTPKQKAQPVEDLRGKLLKTPKEPKRPQEESLEGVKELLKTPKHKGVSVEDMVGVKRVMQTPKEKSDPVLCAAGLQRLMKTPKEKSEQHEDLTGVKELMQTPKLTENLMEDTCGKRSSMRTSKQKNEVNKGLTGLQQLMKTPKHKGEPVVDEMALKRLMQTPKEKAVPLEDYTGVKQLMQTPKQKGEPVNKKFGISKLMKTPRQKGVVAEEDFMGLKELVEEPERSRDVTKLMETQETVPAVENDSAEGGLKTGMETEVLKSVHPQSPAKAETHNKHCDLETGAVIPQKTPCDQTEEKPVSVEVTDVCSSEGETKELSEETPDNVAEPATSSCTAEQEEIKPSVVSNTQRSSRGRAAQKPRKGTNEMAEAPAVLSLIEERAPPPPSRGRRGKKLTEVPEIAASPLRKSGRGRVPKQLFEEKEATNSEAPTESMTTDVLACLPVAAKTKKGRKAQKDAEAEPVQDMHADTECSEELVQVPLQKTGRRRINKKMESQPSEEHQQITEIICEENVASDSVSLQTSEVTEAPIITTRARKGRSAKKESLKTETSSSLESDVTSPDVAVVAEKPLTSVTKSGRGRMSRKETVKDQALDKDPKVETKVDDQEEPKEPVVKSGRGQRTKRHKQQMAEEVDNQPAVDTSTRLTEERPGAEEVKLVRRGRPTKQSKDKVSEEAVENIVSVVQHAEVPVVKPGRKRAVAKDTDTGVEVPVKRGRRTVVDPAPPIPVVSSRGRKAVIRAEPEVTHDAASSEEQVKPSKQTRRTTKVPELKKTENPTQASAECVAAENTAPEKVGRGTRGKKEKGSSRDAPKNLIDEPATTEESSIVKTSKTVNWSQDLLTIKDIKKCEHSADVKETPQKKSKRMDKSAAKTIPTECDQSVDQPQRGRRSKVGKKEEEPSVEDCPAESQIKVKPLRRGKAAAPKPEPKDNKASTPLKRKRNEGSNDSVEEEVLPKKRGRVAKTPEPKAPPKKNSKQMAKSQSEAAQKPDPVQKTISGTATGKGRRLKKAEDISTEAATVRRSRRK